MKDLLSSCGGDEYIPLFAKKQISMKQLQYMQDKELKEVNLVMNPQAPIKSLPVSWE